MKNFLILFGGIFCTLMLVGLAIQDSETPDEHPAEESLTVKLNNLSHSELDAVIDTQLKMDNPTAEDHEILTEAVYAIRDKDNLLEQLFGNTYSPEQYKALANSLSNSQYDTKTTDVLVSTLETYSLDKTEHNESLGDLTFIGIILIVICCTFMVAGHLPRIDTFA